MRNRDMPAFPQGDQWGTETPVPEGLTKLEFAAVAAMQGILAGTPSGTPYPATTNDKNSNRYVARNALSYANALFDELEGAMSETVTLGDATVGVNVGYGDVVTCTVCGGPPGSCSRNIDDCPHR